MTHQQENAKKSADHSQCLEISWDSLVVAFTVWENALQVGAGAGLSIPRFGSCVPQSQSERQGMPISVLQQDNSVCNRRLFGLIWDRLHRWKYMDGMGTMDKPIKRNVTGPKQKSTTDFSLHVQIFKLLLNSLVHTHSLGQTNFDFKMDNCHVRDSLLFKYWEQLMAYCTTYNRKSIFKHPYWKEHNRRGSNSL